MRTNYEVRLSEGFVFNTENGKLEEYKPIGITFDLENEQVIYHGLFHNGKREILEKDFKLYKNVSEYERGQISIADLKSFKLHNIFNSKFECDKDGNYTAWKLVDNKPVVVDLSGCKVHYDVRDGRILWKTMKINIDGQLFKCYQDAVNMGDIIVVDKDGNETTRTGLLKALQLNDEQKELLQKFAEAAKALQDANIVLGYDNEECELFCYNKVDNVDKECYECDEMIRIDDFVTKANVPIREWLSCDGLWMKYED